MNEELVPVELKGLVPTPGGAALFLQGEEKIITMFVDAGVASAIQMALNGDVPPRPLTHDLMLSAFAGLGVTVSSVVINDFAEETYFARLHLTQENELGKNLVEIDGRPSDCLVLALRAEAPLYVARPVWDGAEDMSAVLKKMQGDADGDGEE